MNRPNEFFVIVERDEDGMYIGEAPNLPACTIFSQTMIVSDSGYLSPNLDVICALSHWRMARQFTTPFPIEHSTYSGKST